MIRKFLLFAIKCIPYLMSAIMFTTLGYVSCRDGFSAEMIMIAPIGFGFMYWIKDGVCEYPRHNDASEQNTDDLLDEWEHMNKVLREDRLSDG